MSTWPDKGGLEKQIGGGESRGINKCRQVHIAASSLVTFYEMSNYSGLGAI